MQPANAPLLCTTWELKIRILCPYPLNKDLWKCAPGISIFSRDAGGCSQCYVWRTHYTQPLQTTHQVCKSSSNTSWRGTQTFSTIHKFSRLERSYCQEWAKAHSTHQTNCLNGLLLTRASVRFYPRHKVYNFSKHVSSSEKRNKNGIIIWIWDVFASRQIIHRRSKG